MAIIQAPHLKMICFIMILYYFFCKFYAFLWKKLCLTLFYLGVGRRGGQKCPTLQVFLKHLQNYLLNWLEIFKVWFSNCLKAVLKKLLKIGVMKALNHALSWMTIYQKKFPKIVFLFFFNNFSLFVISIFPCCVCW